MTIHSILDRSMKAASELPESEPENASDAEPVPQAVEAEEEPIPESPDFPAQENSEFLETETAQMSEYPSLPIDEFQVTQESHADHTEITQEPTQRLPHTVVQLPEERRVKTETVEQPRDRELATQFVQQSPDRPLPFRSEEQRVGQPQWEEQRSQKTQDFDFSRLEETLAGSMSDMQDRIQNYIAEAMDRQVVTMDRRF